MKRVMLLVGAVLVTAACSKTAGNGASKHPIDPDEMDKRCEQIGEMRKIDVSPEDAAWFKDKCYCLDDRVGCGRITSKRYEQRKAPFEVWDPKPLTPEQKQKGAPVLATLAKSSDEMSEWTWYRDPAAAKQVLGKYIRFYFGQMRGQDSIGPLRLKVQFEGGSWIFARRVTFKVDDKLIEFTPKGDWKHENGGGRVWESFDIPISHTDPDLMQALGRASAIKIRFHGDDEYSDFTVPVGQVEALNRIYAAWAVNAGVKGADDVLAALNAKVAATREAEEKRQAAMQEADEKRKADTKARALAIAPTRKALAELRNTFWECSNSDKAQDCNPLAQKLEAACKAHGLSVSWENPAKDECYRQ